MAKKGATRSPRYPAIGLEEAVKKVRMLYEADQQAGSPAETAVKHMGFKSRSGPANTTLAALKRFGLVESQGSRIVPTRRAVSILLLPSDDRRRVDAMQDACMEPEIYRELFERFRETGFPSEETLQHDLVLEEGFNPNSVKGFVKDWKESLIYCGLTDDDGGVLSSKYSGDDWLNEDQAPEPSVVRDRSAENPGRSEPKQRTKSRGTKEDVYTLSGGDAVLQWPESISEEEYEEIADWLQLLLKKMKRSIGEEKRRLFAESERIAHSVDNVNSESA